MLKRGTVSRLFIIITPQWFSFCPHLTNMSKLLTTGATPRPLPGQPYAPRLEIATFVRETNIMQFSLYIQALRRWYIVSAVHMSDSLEQSAYITSQRLPRLPITKLEAFTANHTSIGTSRLVSTLATVSIGPLFSLRGTDHMSCFLRSDSLHFFFFWQFLIVRYFISKCGKRI
jgi:hypothetical protein